MGHINKNRHKAQHGGYKKKHSQQEVNAQHSFWLGLNLASESLRVNQKDVLPEGTQLKIKFL